MKRALTIQKDYHQIGTIKDLSSVFEAIASIHIAKIKDEVMSSTAFFEELWQVYSHLHASRDEIGGLSIQRKPRRALLAITSEGGLIGDIDLRIINTMLKEDLTNTDIYVMGSHGAGLLAQRNIKPAKVFHLPASDKDINIRPVAELFGEYQKGTVYYQTYTSLTRQDVAHIDLFSAVQAMGQNSAAGEEEIEHVVVDVVHGRLLSCD